MYDDSPHVLADVADHLDTLPCVYSLAVTIFISICELYLSPSIPLLHALVDSNRWLYLLSWVHACNCVHVHVVTHYWVSNAELNLYPNYDAVRSTGVQ